MIRIALLGGPGSGKSSQCAHIFSTLKTEHILIEQIQEWVREAYNKKLLPSGNPWVQFWIYEEQKKKEDCIPKEIQYIVTDSPTLLSYVYALRYSKIPDDSYLIIKMYENFVNDLRRYHYIFVCTREKKYVNDGTRLQTEDEAKDLDKSIIYLLDQHNIKYTVLNGTTTERTDRMREVIVV
jgi:adenylate kinase family enzyme